MNQLEVNVEGVGLEGQGVARDGKGNLYFIPGALPGDRVHVQYSETSRRYRDAILLEVLEPSPERRAPGCEYFNSCGGCDWLNWDYKAQLNAKDKILKHTLERLEISPKRLLPIIGCEPPYHYRTRVQLRQRGNLTGFHRRGSRELVDVDACLVAHPKLNEALGGLRRQSPSAAEEARKVELYLRSDGGVGQIINESHGFDGFTQPNAVQNAVLRDLVASFFKESPSKQVLELFCGSGNLTGAYVDEAQAVLGVDGNQRAIDLATQTFGENANLSFIRMNISPKAVSRLPARFRSSYDTLLVDPPRSGIQGGLLPFVHSGLKRIIYVSCSPPAFSKDVRGLKSLGFHAEFAQAIDMFPQTRHVEFVTVFLRSPSQ